MIKEIEAALRGDKRALWDRLARGSGLPGPRPNLDLANEVADLFEGKGTQALPLATAMATIHADEARGGSALEFIPMVGVLALGALAAKMGDREREKPFATIHDAAEDLRFRVRDVVPVAVARIGKAHPDWTIRNLASWMDGFFHAAAVMRALAEPSFLHAMRDGEEVARRIDEALALAESANRAAARYPGFKALLDAVVSSTPPIAARFPAQTIDVLERFVFKSKDPVLRDVVEQAARASKNAESVLVALERTAPPRRDPRTDVGPTRRRGKRRVL